MKKYVIQNKVTGCFLMRPSNVWTDNLDEALVLSSSDIYNSGYVEENERAVEVYYALKIKEDA